MRRSPVRNQGWTLMEMAVVAVIAGILSALAIPSMVGMQGRSELRDATNRVKAALQEAQRNAIKRGGSCTVTMTSTTVTASPAGCLSSPVNFPSSITQSFNNVGLNLVFTYKGNTTLGRTTVIESSKTAERRCIVTSNGIGLFRSGTYKNKVELPVLGTLNPDHCATEI